MASISWKSEDFSEPFDPNNFVERISANVVGGGTKGGQEGFDPIKLREHFLETIKSLQQLSEKTDAHIVKLERVCRDQEQKHKEKAADVEKQYKTAMTQFHDLDDRINSVATKVVHLGDQLENISIPRQRVQEAEHVMKYFDEFHSGKELSPVFNDPKKLHEAAKLICQLLMVADELPKEKFERVHRKIQEKYSTIESDLQKEFIGAYKEGKLEQMTECAKTLLPFKNYHLCYEELIRMATDDFFVSSDIFNDVIPACQKMQDIVTKVFDSNAEHVLARFVQYIFEKKLAGHIYKQLPDPDVEGELYLKKLSKLYGRYKEINKKLSELRLGSDSSFLDRASKPMFSNYLKRYIEDELQYLEEESASALNRFYNSIGHIKKEVKQNFMSEMPDSLRELQRKIDLGREKNTLKDSLLSQDVAINILYENKLAIRRAEMLSMSSELPRNVYKIFKVFLKYLGEEHFEYAIDVTLQFLPPLEPKSPPHLLFFTVLYNSNIIFHLIEKHFTDFILRNVGSSVVYGKCASLKKSLIDRLETKLNQGMERILCSILNYLKFILNSEQKKTDFRPEDDQLGGAMSQTSACIKCCRYIKSVLPDLKLGLDGKNLEVVLTEFGTRFHKLLMDHLYQYTFSDIGGMVALCDVNEYRHCIKNFNIPLLNRLFSVMLALVNLLVVQPENLKEVGGDEQLADIDKNVLQQFVQLRADYKTLKLGKVFT